MASNDSDLRQLLSERVTMLTMAPWKALQAAGTAGLVQLTAESFRAKGGFPPAAFPLFRAMAGHPFKSSEVTLSNPQMSANMTGILNLDLQTEVLPQTVRNTMQRVPPHGRHHIERLK